MAARIRALQDQHSWLACISDFYSKSIVQPSPFGIFPPLLYRSHSNEVSQLSHHPVYFPRRGTHLHSLHFILRESGGINNIYHHSQMSQTGRRPDYRHTNRRNRDPSHTSYTIKLFVRSRRRIFPPLATTYVDQLAIETARRRSGSGHQRILPGTHRLQSRALIHRYPEGSASPLVNTPHCIHAFV